MPVNRLLFLVGFVFGLGVVLPALAQNPPPPPTTAIVTATCGVGAPASTVGQRLPLTRDQNGNLCVTGVAQTGSTSNANSGVATSSGNGSTVSYLYGFNGTTWDQLQVDASKSLKTNLFGFNATLQAGQTTSLQVGGTVASGTVLSGASNPIPVAGSDYGGTPKQQTVKVDSAGNLYIQCANCTGTGLSQTDESSFIGGTSLFASSGGFFQTTPTNNALTNLQMGTFQVTAQRSLFVNLRDANGKEWNLLNPLPIVDTTLAPAMQNMNLNVNLATIGTKLFFLGPNTQANSIPTVDASDQPARAVRQSIASQLNATVVEPVLDATVVGGKVTVTATNLPVNEAQINGNTILTAGVNGTQAIGGSQATGGLISTEVFPMLIAGSDYAGTPRKQGWKVDSSGTGYINCSNCTGSGVSNTDQGTWIAGTSQFASGGGVYQTNPKSNSLLNNQFGTFQTTAYRALFTNLRDATGNELGTFASPLTVQSWTLGNVIAASLGSGRQLSQKSISVALAWDSPPLPIIQRDSGNGDATDPIAHSIVMSPYAPRAQTWRGTATSSDTNAHTIVVSSPGQKVFVTGVQCFRTDVGSTMQSATLNDTASTPVALPPSGGSNMDFLTPLVVARDTSLTFLVSPSIASVTCDAQGFYAAN